MSALGGRVLARFDTRDDVYRGIVDLASIGVWLRPRQLIYQTPP